jgi:hypothetical protein
MLKTLKKIPNYLKNKIQTSHLRSSILCHTWWHMPVILTLRKFRQEDRKASLGYTARPCLNKTTENGLEVWLKQYSSYLARVRV